MRRARNAISRPQSHDCPEMASEAVIVIPMLPSRLLSPNARVHWRKWSREAGFARTVAAWATRAALDTPGSPVRQWCGYDHGGVVMDIAVAWCCGRKRMDDDNLIAACKPGNVVKLASNQGKCRALLEQPRRGTAIGGRHARSVYFPLDAKRRCLLARVLRGAHACRDGRDAGANGQRRPASVFALAVAASGRVVVGGRSRQAPGVVRARRCGAGLRATRRSRIRTRANEVERGPEGAGARVDESPPPYGGARRTRVATLRRAEASEIRDGRGAEGRARGGSPGVVSDARTSSGRAGNAPHAGDPCGLGRKESGMVAHGNAGAARTDG